MRRGELSDDKRGEKGGQGRGGKPKVTEKWRVEQKTRLRDANRKQIKLHVHSFRLGLEATEVLEGLGSFPTNTDFRQWLECPL